MTTHLISFFQTGFPLLHEITPFFSPLNTYLPWGGDTPEYRGGEEMTVLYPPEELKPVTDLDMLLNECFRWASEQGEKSRREIIKTGHTGPTSGESLRRIKAILAGRPSSDTSERDTVIKWHVLLHLAKRLEENRAEADRMLKDLKKKPSPLLNNADLTEKTKYPLENLSGIGPESFFSDRNTKQLLRAWYGLFNSYVKECEPLLTIDRYIFDFIIQEWNNLINDNNIEKPKIISFKIPLVKEPDKNNSETRTSIDIGNEIRNIACSDSGYQNKISALTELAGSLESKYRAKDSEHHALISLFYLDSIENCVDIEKDAFLGFISGRVLILAEITA